MRRVEEICMVEIQIDRGFDGDGRRSGRDCGVLEFNQNGGRMTSFMALGCL